MVNPARVIDEREEEEERLGFARPPQIPSFAEFQRRASTIADEITQAVTEAAQTYNVPEPLIRAVIQAESSGNPRAVSPKGAQGLMQLMPATARALGVTDPFNIRQNVLAGTNTLAQELQRFGNLEDALAAYNAGSPHVSRVKQTGEALYPETQQYVERVKGYLAARTPPAAERPVAAPAVPPEIPREVPPSPMAGRGVPPPEAAAMPTAGPRALGDIYAQMRPPEAATAPLAEPPAAPVAAPPPAGRSALPSSPEARASWWDVFSEMRSPTPPPTPPPQKLRTRPGLSQEEFERIGRRMRKPLWAQVPKEIADSPEYWMGRGSSFRQDVEAQRRTPTIGKTLYERAVPAPVRRGAADIATGALGVAQSFGGLAQWAGLPAEGFVASMDSILGDISPRDPNLMDKFLQAAGSSAAFILPGIATAALAGTTGITAFAATQGPRIARLTGAAAEAVTESLSNAGAEYLRILEEQGPQATREAGRVARETLSGNLAVNMATAWWSPIAVQGRSWLRRVAKVAGVQGVQEPLQDITASGARREAPEAGQVLESAFLGAAVGLLFGAGAPRVLSGKEAARESVDAVERGRAPGMVIADPEMVEPLLGARRGRGERPGALGAAPPPRVVLRQLRLRDGTVLVYNLERVREAYGPATGPQAVTTRELESRLLDAAQQGPEALDAVLKGQPIPTPTAPAAPPSTPEAAPTQPRGEMDFEVSAPAPETPDTRRRGGLAAELAALPYEDLERYARDPSPEGANLARSAAGELVRRLPGTRGLERGVPTRAGPVAEPRDFAETLRYLTPEAQAAFLGGPDAPAAAQAMMEGLAPGLPPYRLRPPEPGFQVPSLAQMFTALPDHDLQRLATTHADEDVRKAAQSVLLSRESGPQVPPAEVLARARAGRAPGLQSAQAVAQARAEQLAVEEARRRERAALAEGRDPTTGRPLRGGLAGGLVPGPAYQPRVPRPAPPAPVPEGELPTATVIAQRRAEAAEALSALAESLAPAPTVQPEPQPAPQPAPAPPAAPPAAPKPVMPAKERNRAIGVLQRQMGYKPGEARRAVQEVLAANPHITRAEDVVVSLIRSRTQESTARVETIRPQPRADFEVRPTAVPPEEGEGPAAPPGEPPAPAPGPAPGPAPAPPAAPAVPPAEPGAGPQPPAPPPAVPSGAATVELGGVADGTRVRFPATGMEGVVKGPVAGPVRTVIVDGKLTKLSRAQPVEVIGAAPSTRAAPATSVLAGPAAPAVGRVAVGPLAEGDPVRVMLDTMRQRVEEGRPGRRVFEIDPDTGRATGNIAGVEHSSYPDWMGVNFKTRERALAAIAAAKAGGQGKDAQRVLEIARDLIREEQAGPPVVPVGVRPGAAVETAWGPGRVEPFQSDELGRAEAVPVRLDASGEIVDVDPRQVRPVAAPTGDIPFDRLNRQMDELGAGLPQMTQEEMDRWLSDNLLPYGREPRPQPAQAPAPAAPLPAGPGGLPGGAVPGARPRGLEGAGIRTLAAGRPAPQARGGRINFRGADASTADRVAELARVFRDPQVETVRLIYIDAQGRALDWEGVSANLPGAGPSPIPLVNGRPDPRVVAELQARMRRLGATGYWIEHNHPSGVVWASPEDVRLTRTIGEALPGLRGHIIIDHEQYGLISPNGTAQILPVPGASRFGPDPLRTATVPHLFLGTTVMTDEDVAFLGNLLKTPDGWMTTMYLDGNLRIVGIQEVPLGLFRNQETTSDFLRGQQRRFGAVNVVLAAPIRTVDAGTQFAIRGLAQRGRINGFVDTESGRSLAGRTPIDVTLGRGRAKRVEIREQTPEERIRERVRIRHQNAIERAIRDGRMTVDAARALGHFRAYPQLLDRLADLVHPGETVLSAQQRSALPGPVVRIDPQTGARTVIAPATETEAQAFAAARRNLAQEAAPRSLRVVPERPGAAVQPAPAPAAEPAPAPPAPPPAPRFERTREGMQAMVPGTERREIPPGPIRKRTTKPPLESAQAEPNLFNQEAVKRVQDLYESQGDLFRESEAPYGEGETVIGRALEALATPEARRTAAQQDLVQKLAAAMPELMPKLQAIADAPTTGRVEGRTLDPFQAEPDVLKFLGGVRVGDQAGLTEARGQQSWADTDRMADELMALGFDEEAIRRQVARGVLNTAQMEAAERLLLHQHQKLHASADAILRDLEAGRVNQDAIREWTAQYLHTLAFVKTVQGQTSEIARALNARRKLIEAMAAVGVTRQTLEAGQTRALTPEAAQAALDAVAGGDVNRAVRMIAQFRAIPRTDVKARTHFVKQAWQPKWWDYLHELRIASLVSGPSSHLANLIGNSVMLGATVQERRAAATIDRILSSIRGTPRQVFAQEAAAEVVGFASAVRSGRALRAASLAWQTEGMGDVQQKYEAPRLAFKGRTGRVIRASLRALAAEDAAFKAAAFEMELHGTASRIAMREGLEGDAYARRMAELIQNPTPEMLERAGRARDYRTFTTKMGKFAQSFNAWRNHDSFFGFLVRSMVPFFNTGTNIAKRTLERTPAGFLHVYHRFRRGDFNPPALGQLTLEGASGRPPEELAEALARPMLGSLYMILVGGLAALGWVTGIGPADWRKRALDRETGDHAPNSWWLGPLGWVSYQRLEPIGSLMGIAADVVETVWEGREDPTKFLNELAQIPMNNVVDKTWWVGMEGVADLVSDPGRYGQRWMEQQVRSGIPYVGLVSGVARMLDTKEREIEGIRAAILANIPLARTLLPERLGILGRPQERDDTALERFASPLRRIQPKPGAVAEREFRRVGIEPGKPSRSITIRREAVPLTAGEYHRLRRAINEELQKYVGRLVDRPGYQHASLERQERILERARRMIQDRERNRMRREVWRRLHAEPAER